MEDTISWRRIKKEGIDLEIIHICAKQIRGCASFFNRLTTKSGKCVIPDELNDIIEKLKEADGLIKIFKQRNKLAV